MKTGQAVCVPLPRCVISALKKIERPGRRYFSTGNAKLATARANWSRYLASLFALAKIENGHSNRFRDTFSTSLLEQGVSVENVAVLLGNTPAIVTKHYAPWIKSRQLVLEAAVRTTWESAIVVAEPNTEACESQLVLPISDVPNRDMVGTSVLRVGEARADQTVSQKAA